MRQGEPLQPGDVDRAKAPANELSEGLQALSTAAAFWSMSTA